MAMSEELEWELCEIFECALFHFPIYEHRSARRIVRYLLRRGVLAEEIADSIEESDLDLTAWLNRQGKGMVGEWVISWINESRAEYLADRGLAECGPGDGSRLPDRDSDDDDGDSDSDVIVLPLRTNRMPQVARSGDIYACIDRDRQRSASDSHLDSRRVMPSTLPPHFTPSAPQLPPRNADWHNVPPSVTSEDTTLRCTSVAGSFTVASVYAEPLDNVFDGTCSPEGAVVNEVEDDVCTMEENIYEDPKDFHEADIMAIDPCYDIPDNRPVVFSPDQGYYDVPRLGLHDAPVDPDTEVQNIYDIPRNISNSAIDEGYYDIPRSLENVFSPNQSASSLFSIFSSIPMDSTSSLTDSSSQIISNCCGTVMTVDDLKRSADSLDSACTECVCTVMQYSIAPEGRTRSNEVLNTYTCLPDGTPCSVCQPSGQLKSCEHHFTLATPLTEGEEQSILHGSYLSSDQYSGDAFIGKVLPCEHVLTLDVLEDAPSGVGSITCVRDGPEKYSSCPVADYCPPRSTGPDIPNIAEVQSQQVGHILVLAAKEDTEGGPDVYSTSCVATLPVPDLGPVLCHVRQSLAQCQLAPGLFRCPLATIIHAIACAARLFVQEE